MDLLTPPLVLNTCPRCDGSGNVDVRSSSWFHGATFVCPSCKTVLQLTQKHSGTRTLLVIHGMVASLSFGALVYGESTEAEVWTNVVASFLIFYPLFRIPFHKPRFELYRPWQFTLRSLTLVALDIAAILCALVAGNPIPLAVASWVAVWMARRESATAPLAN